VKTKQEMHELDKIDNTTTVDNSMTNSNPATKSNNTATSTPKTIIEMRQSH